MLVALCTVQFWNKTYFWIGGYTVSQLIYVYVWRIFVFHHKIKLFLCIINCVFSSVPSLSHVQLFETQWTAACQASLSTTNSWSLLKLMSIELVMPSNHLNPRSSPSPPAFSLSQHQSLSNESVLCIKWSNYWSFSFSISPSNEYSGLISFRLDWLDLLALQGTLKSLLQQHSSNPSVLWFSAFFVVQHSHPYITTGRSSYV